MTEALTYRVLEDLAAFNEAISERFEFRTIALFCTQRGTFSSKFVREEFNFIDESTGPQILAVTLDEPEGGYWRYLQEGAREEHDRHSVHTMLAKLGDRNRAVYSKQDLSLGQFDDGPPSREYFQELCRRIGLPIVDGPFILLFSIPERERDIWTAQAYATIYLRDRLFAQPPTGQAVLKKIFTAIRDTHDIVARDGVSNLREHQRLFRAKMEDQSVLPRDVADVLAAPLLPFGVFVAYYNTRNDDEIKLIITLHGINTYGTWQKTITPWVGSRGWVHYPVDFAKFPKNILDAVAFVAGYAPERLLQVFRETYRDIVRDPQYSRHKDHIAVIAHSFGTKIVADSLLRYQHLMSFERLIFCGSIVNANFDWASHLRDKRIQGLLNEYGSYDIWTRVYGWPRQNKIAGVTGFSRAPPSIVNRLRKVSHSDWFNQLQFTEVWAPYLKTGVPPAP